MAVNVCFSVKLSPNKKSIFGLRMSSQILCLVLFTSFLAAASAADPEVSCATVQSIFEKKGMLSMIDREQQPNSGENHAPCTVMISINDNIISFTSSINFF